MDTFTLEQNRYSVTDEAGVLTFRIDLTCNVVRNPSSDVILTPDVFVYSVDDTLEADVSSGGSVDGSFIRVATISDLGSLHTSREEALASNSTEYRLRVLQLSMPDLETAINSIPVIVDRVNSLVSTYITYQKNFYSQIPVSYSLPTATDSSVVNKYVSAYSNAITARKSAVEEQEALQTEFQALQVKNEILNSYIEEITSFLEVLSTSVSAVEALSQSSSTTISSLGDVLPLAIKLLNNKALLTALRDNRQAMLSSSKSQEEFSSSQLKEKQNEVARLEAAEADSLADLATFCPQIDPSSVS